MTNPRYEVISHQSNGKRIVEATFQNEWDAYKYADILCKQYGPHLKQDFEDSEKIVKITTNPVWILD